MSVKLKPINEQVIVITGASSGIGLATARLAASRGARLVLAARNEEALNDLVRELEADGAEAVGVIADVGKEEDVRRVAERAAERFGGFDTWVNNAGITTYGRIEEISIEDHRRLFETNFWGVVYGSRIAAERLRERGGALINVGSTVGDRAIPLQGMYSASKHAVKGFTEALRMELEEAGAPVSVTLIKPGSIDTPYIEHAKNYQDTKATLPAPIYAPHVVAEAIVHCAEHPERDMYAGGGGRALGTLGQQTPRMMDRFMEATMFDQQRSDVPEDHPEHHSLYAPVAGGSEHGPYSGMVREHSFYTTAAMHPFASAMIGAGAVLSGAALWRSMHRPDGR